MRIKLLGSTVGEGAPRHFASSYLVNDSLAIDAGTLGLLSPLEAQRGVRHVLLSHSHIDHLATLPLFLDNVYEASSSCPTIYAGAAVSACLERDLFNDRLWPDLLRLSVEKHPFLRMRPLEPGARLQLDDLAITAVELDHVVPTYGFLVEQQDVAVAIVSDTGPTDRFWELARGLPHLKAVFLEAAFPDSQAELAQASRHLTPATFAGELEKLGRPVRVIAVHIKPAFHEQVVAELQALGLANLEIGEPGREYSF